MINLLPPKEKEEILQEESFKLFLISGILLVAFLISFALILLSVKIYITGDLETQKILLEQKKFENVQLQELEKEIVRQNLILSNLNSFYQKDLKISEALKKISQTLPPDNQTYLTNLRILPITKEEAKESWFQVSLSGFCPQRETLLGFKKSLEEEKLFQEVNFPPSNWVKATDINFSVNFKIKIK